MYVFIHVHLSSDSRSSQLCVLWQQDIEDLDHYDMKEEPVDGKKSEDDGIEKENLAILEKIRKNQRQDHLNVSAALLSLPSVSCTGPHDHAPESEHSLLLCTLLNFSGFLVIIHLCVKPVVIIDLPSTSKILSHIH